MTSTTAGPPCPKCGLPTKGHCGKSFVCNWMKCFNCAITIGPRRTVDGNGRTVP